MGALRSGQIHRCDFKFDNRVNMASPKWMKLPVQLLLERS